MIPGFVIVGVHDSAGVAVVLASDKLTAAELQHEWFEFDPYSFRHELGRKSTTLTAEMREYTVAKGATFREAMANLATHWHPEERGTTSRLAQGLRRLPAGDDG